MPGSKALRFVDVAGQCAVRVRAGQFQPLFEVFAMFRPRCSRRLDFKRVQSAVALDNQVNFLAGARLPVIDLGFLPVLAKKLKPLRRHGGLRQCSQRGTLQNGASRMQAQHESGKPGIKQIQLGTFP